MIFFDTLENFAKKYYKRPFNTLALYVNNIRSQ